MKKQQDLRLYRALEFAIDFIVYANIPAIILRYFLMEYFSDFLPIQWSSSLSNLFGFLLLFLRDTITPRSLGKMIFGLKVVHTNETEVKKSVLFQRNLYIILFPFDVLSLLIDGQRIADKQKNTKVVKIRQ